MHMPFTHNDTQFLNDNSDVKKTQVNPKILVTGGSGLVGNAIKAVVCEFDQYKHHDFIYVSSKECDLRMKDEVQKLFDKYTNIEAVIHLAANVGGIFKHLSNPVEILEDNILMNTNILHIAHANDIQNVVCCLSTCIFPDKPPTYPITAEMMQLGPPHHIHQGYAYAKRLMDVHCKAYQQQYNRRYFCVVPTNIYGPHDNFHLEHAHVVPALIHKCWLSMQQNTPWVVSGDGNAHRQFVFSNDLARLILWALSEYTNIDVPMIACPPDTEISIHHVVHHIKDAMHAHNLPVIFDPSKPNGQNKKTVDTTTWPACIPFTPFSVGIKITVEWFVDAIKNNVARM